MFYTLCVPFIDIFINNAELVPRLGLSPNEMTLYSHLTPIKQRILAEALAVSESTKYYYGGMSYNTCVEIAKREENIKTVFIGPFANDSITKSVFGKAISGGIHNFQIIPELITSDPGKCYVIPNTGNRAMITKVNEKQVLSTASIDNFIEHINFTRKNTENPVRSALYISAYTVESSTQPLLYLIEKKEEAEPFMLILNLADPGVITRDYKNLKHFLKISDWIIGNIAEFTELFKQEREKRLNSNEELYSHLQKNYKNLVITSGSENAVLLWQHNGEKHTTKMSPETIKVTNTTGAGDVFAAAFFSSILKSPESPEIALRLGIERTSEYLKASSQRGL